MFYFLLSLHSLVRWLVLFSLLFSLYTALKGLARKRAFTPMANAIRHWTATIAHIQLMIWIIIYFQSPVVKSMVSNEGHAIISNRSFFRYLHISLMFLAIVLITIGSAKAKRMDTDKEKYGTTTKWFGAALVLILLAIPWPFYEHISRPLIRNF